MSNRMGRFSKFLHFSKLRPRQLLRADGNAYRGTSRRRVGSDTSRTPKLGICQDRGPREDLFSSAHEVDRRSWPTTSPRILCGHGVARTWSTDEPIGRDPLNGFQGCRTRRLTPATLPAHPVIRSDLIRSAPRLAGHLHTLEGGGGGGHTPFDSYLSPAPR